MAPNQASKAAEAGKAAPQLPAKPPRLQPGHKIQKRPLNRRVRTPGSNSNIIYVGTKSPFMGVVRSVRKALENSPAGVRGQSTKGLPLSARIAALSTGGGGGGGSSDGPGGSNPEVLVRGTSRAIEKTLHVAAWFSRQNDCKISLRTLSESTVDDVVKEEEEGGEEDGGFAAEEESRLRMLSCVEVGIRLR